MIHILVAIVLQNSIVSCFNGASHNYRAICCKMGYRTDVPVPAKSKRGREEGDGTGNVINCRDVCRKLSVTFYDDL